MSLPGVLRVQHCLDGHHTNTCNLRYMGHGGLFLMPVTVNRPDVVAAACRP